ncbi:hypothetical protein HHK36_007721 [Tetracentron sinense]|uniref:Uncharacterized protein n=1 Tax=Tetracentron sinense TaxID=13715 RepID=A0A834ZH62_TETSI|nr:hypothetical protein HHK36_007721 [Tetracentron sinense]
MASKRGGARPSFAGNTNSSSKGKNVSPQYGHVSGGSGCGNNSPGLDQLNRDVGKISLDSAQEGDWEVIAKKSKNRAGSGSARPWGPQNSTPNAWSHPDVVQKLGMMSNGGGGKAPGGTSQTQTTDSKRLDGGGNARPQSINRGSENTYMVPLPVVVPPPLQHGWQWAARSGSSHSKASEDDQGTKFLPQGFAGGEDSGPDTDGPTHLSDVHDGDDDDDIDDTDDDILSDDYDSDASQKSHETLKNSKWFKEFFVVLDKFTNEEINESERQWHCPACKGGPGGIDWYRGLQPLMTHAKTKGAKRVKLHRDFAELLDEELHRRGTSVVPAGEAFGKWEGLRETVKDHDIIWPPMVVIMNTKLEQDENYKWIGMGNQELLEYFSSYHAVKARHSYGPQGHRGISVLIFEGNAMGYLEAERLHKHFSEQRTDRDAWDHHRVMFYPGGKRQLYGYMALKEDLDNFNQHSQGKSKLKFEMRSYQEMVVGPMKQMSEDNQELVWLKNRAVKEQMHKKTLQESFVVMSEKLRKTMEENRIVRQRTKMQHEQNKEEMDYQEQFFKDQLNIIHQDLEEKERTFEIRLQEERENVKQSDSKSKTKDGQLRGEEIARFIKCQDKGIEEFEAERDGLITMHEGEKTEMKRRHFEEELELERKFEAALTSLMEQYTPRCSGEDTTTNL